MKWNIEHYASVQEMTNRLPVHPFHQWVGGVLYSCTGVTLHHTWKPTLAQWRGLDTMKMLGRYYASLGWPSGPHLFLAAGSKNPKWDGIWRGTPLDYYGVHAKQGNRRTLGIEVVGNYDAFPWSPLTEELVLDVITALLKWIGGTSSDVYGHREWTHDKTCPGRAIDMNVVRSKIEARLK